VQRRTDAAIDGKVATSGALNPSEIGADHSKLRAERARARHVRHIQDQDRLPIQCCATFVPRRECEPRWGTGAGRG
jgi:hypothetical protein